MGNFPPNGNVHRDNDELSGTQFSIKYRRHNDPEGEHQTTPIIQFFQSSSRIFQKLPESPNSPENSKTSASPRQSSISQLGTPGMLGFGFRAVSSGSPSKEMPSAAASACPMGSFPLQSMGNCWIDHQNTGIFMQKHAKTIRLIYCSHHPCDMWGLTNKSHGLATNIVWECFNQLEDKWHTHGNLLLPIYLSKFRSYS